MLSIVRPTKRVFHGGCVQGCLILPPPPPTPLVPHADLPDIQPSTAFGHKQQHRQKHKKKKRKKLNKKERTARPGEHLCYKQAPDSRFGW